MFFYVKQNLHPESCLLADVNEELINAWTEVRDNVEYLISVLQDYVAGYKNPPEGQTQEEYYYEVRSWNPHSPAYRAAAFIFLNKTCFNGLYRVNKKGLFNVPVGRYKNPSIFDPDHLRRVSALLQGVEIVEEEYVHIIGPAGPGDFIYADPPYEPITRTSFTSYTKGDFRQIDQTRLMGFLQRSFADFMISNSTADFIENLYNHPLLEKHYVSARRNINSNGLGRGAIKELVVTNY